MAHYFPCSFDSWPARAAVYGVTGMLFCDTGAGSTDTHTSRAQNTRIIIRTLDLYQYQYSSTLIMIISSSAAPDLLFILFFVYFIVLSTYT